MSDWKELCECLIQSDTPYVEGQVDVFVQKIRLAADRQLMQAKLAITALGVYEAELNGEKIGDILFAPGFTYYPRELQVNEYDLTDLFQKADSETVSLRVYLGQGWYCGRFTFENKTQIYGSHAAAAWILELVYEDGSKEVFSSTPDTVVGEESPYEYVGLYDGEIYHAHGRHRPASWKVIASKQTLPGNLDAPLARTRRQEEMPLPTVISHGENEAGQEVTILDFGQNFAGQIRIDPHYLSGLPDGAKIILRHGELLTAEGTLYTANLRKAKQETVYYKGGETRPYLPRFTYMGFRYVELTGCPYREGLLTAFAVYTDMERTGRFTCRNPLVDRLYQNQLWSQKSNYIEVPTDCPQRDEREGYTGDGQAFARTGMYNFNTKIFLEKFLRDIRYTQMDHAEKYVSPVVPADGPGKIGFMNMLGWGNAVTILPRLIADLYGDKAALREQYDSIRAHVDCEISHMGGLLGKKNLWIAPNLGDWLAPGKDTAYMAMHNGPVSNAFLINDLRILSALAKRLGEKEDTDRYGKQYRDSREAYIQAFIKKNGQMKDDYQGAYVMALALVLGDLGSLLPEEKTDRDAELYGKVFQTLVRKLREEGIGTGFYATQYLLPLLAEGGEEKLAYDLLLSEKCPGWMYEVKAGATSIWERWDGLMPDGSVNETKMSGDNMVSFNHYAFGSVGRFYYEYILGIQPKAPGFEQIQIRPIVDERLGKVSGSYRSPRGEIRVTWEIRDTGDQERTVPSKGIEGTGSGRRKALFLAVTVPAETEVIFPSGATETLAAGSYERREILAGQG